MSLVSDDKEKMIQTGNTFYNCLLKLNSSINDFIQLLTCYLGSQIPSIIVNESGTVKDYFEAVVISLKKVQGDIESRDKPRHDCSHNSKIAAPKSPVLEKCAVKKSEKFCEAPKGISDSCQLPLIHMLKNVNFFENMESALSQLMKSSIMNLYLTDLHKKDTCEPPPVPAQVAGCSCPSSPPRKCADIEKKVNKPVGGQTSCNLTKSIVDNLQEIVKTMEPVADKLQQVTKAMEANFALLKLAK